MSERVEDASKMAEKFGPYQLLKKIAQGGMAEVFLGKKEGVGGFSKLLAIKRIFPHLAEDPELVRMFFDEGRIAAGLNHPNVVQIYDLGKVEKYIYMAMEYVHGCDLRMLCERGLDEDNFVSRHLAVRILADAAAGLHFAHTKLDEDGHPMRIVHRDVSPQNILISINGNVKVCDFGIAKAEERMTETRVGQVKGKFAYMSPEQAMGDGRPIDSRSDIFSLGIMLYEVTLCTRLFRSKSDYETLRMVIEKPIVPPSSYDPSYPKQLETVVMKALERDPRIRYQTAEELQLDLEEFLLDDRAKVSTVHLARYMKELFPELLPEALRKTEGADATYEMTNIEQELLRNASFSNDDIGATVEISSSPGAEGIGARGTPGVDQTMESSEFYQRQAILEAEGSTTEVPPISADSIEPLSSSPFGSATPRSSQSSNTQTSVPAEVLEQVDGRVPVDSRQVSVPPQIQASVPRASSHDGDGVDATIVDETHVDLPDAPSHMPEAQQVERDDDMFSFTEITSAGASIEQLYDEEGQPRADISATIPTADMAHPQQAAASRSLEMPEIKRFAYISIVLLVFLIVGMMVGAKLLGVSPDEIPGRVVDANATSIEIDFVTEPDGAFVVVNGRLRRKGKPVNLEKGKVFQLAFYKDGYHPRRIQIVPEEFDGKTISLKPLSKDVARRRLTIKTEPEDAKVFLDGQEIGQESPNRVKVVTGFEHHIQVRHSNHFSYSGFLYLPEREEGPEGWDELEIKLVSKRGVGPPRPPNPPEGVALQPVPTGVDDEWSGYPELRFSADAMVTAGEEYLEQGEVRRFQVFDKSGVVHFPITVGEGDSAKTRVRIIDTFDLSEFLLRVHVREADSSQQEDE